MQKSSSDAVIRQAAIQQFDELGYTILDGAEEEQGLCSVTGRQSMGEVVLIPTLRKALHELNPDCADELIEKAIKALTDNRSLLSSLAAANEQVYKLLTEDIKVDAGGQIIAEEPLDKRQRARQETHKTIKLIEWKEPTKNTFTLVSHFWIDGKMGRRCLDLVGFVNGLPLVLLEIEDSELPNIFDKIDTDYKTNLPTLFWYNAFLVVADTFSCKMGSLTTPWEHWFQWKRVKDENEVESGRLTTLIEGTCEKGRLLDIVENFTLFDRSRGLNKLIAKNHQYLGVNNAVASLQAWEKKRELLQQTGDGEKQEQHGKLGVFWHTQGSGKSYSMVFFVRKVQRTIANDYTFLVVTDREDLDNQIFDNFHNSGAISEDANEIHAKKAIHLKQLLGEKHLLLFTLIQKFYSEKPGQDYEEISKNEKIIVMADEAHRTQYDTLAKNLRMALPRASFLGFTGTPLMDEEEQTRTTFGQYVSIYNFRRAINDGVTVPLYFENHTPQIELVNENFQEEMIEILDDALIDEQQEKKVGENYARSENFRVKGERLDQVAKDIVRHFMGRGYMGKALVVSINKITAVRTYNRVQVYWESYKEELRLQIEQESDPDRKAELEEKLAYMNQTKMAVVVSSTEEDSERVAAFSKETDELVEIAPHRSVSLKSLAKDFKREEPEKPGEPVLRIAFVCAMWMTGFDVPSLSTIYLDRLLKGHTLMQTIARANRVYKDKLNGMIIDYAGTMGNLVAALKIYAREDRSSYQEGGRALIGDKSELIQQLREKLAETKLFCQEQDIDVQQLLTMLEQTTDKAGRVTLLEPTIDRLVVYDEIKLLALLLTTEVSRCYKAILPDKTEPEFTQLVSLFQLLKSGIYASMRPASVSEVMGTVKKLVRGSLVIHERELRLSPDTLAPRGSFDLRDIDLDALDTQMHSGHRHIKAEQMRQLLYERLKQMIQVNPSRVKYMEKLDRAVDRYNQGCANVATDPQLIDPQEKISEFRVSKEEQQEQLQDEYTEALMEVTRETVQEEQRSEQEGVSEEELAISDLVTLNVGVTEEEYEQIKKVVGELLAQLWPTFNNVPDWEKNPQVSSRVRIKIEDDLSFLKQIHERKVYLQKCEDVFQYVQEHHKNDGTTSVA